MKILLVNNTFGFFGGGSEKATIETGKILHNKGHKVFYFASDRKPFLEENYEFGTFFPKNSKKIFYNLEAKSKLDLLLKRIKPDIVHMNCFQHNLTSSVLHTCRDNNVPVVHTFHDSIFACPAGTLTKKGILCREKDCIKGNPIPCIKNRCFNGSLLKSAISAAEFFFRRNLGFYYIPDYVICPSRYILNLALESGIKREKLVLINNFVNCAEDIGNFRGDYFLYAGRIVKEKGLFHLIQAFKDLPHIKLRIAGKGPVEKSFKNYIKRKKIKNIEFIGLKIGQELENEFKNCFATILPSVCSEVFGLSILESFSYGKPVIASRIGGIPEVISNNKDGIMVEPGSAEEIKNAVLKLWESPDLAKEMGKNARLKHKTLYSPEVYYEKLIDVYERAIRPDISMSVKETLKYVDQAI